MKTTTVDEIQRLVNNYKKLEVFIYKVWSFIYTHDNIIRIETATKLGRPGLEGVIPELENKFKLGISTDDTRKQVVGRIIKILLVTEIGEYENDKPKVVQPRLNSIFRTATRFKKR